MFKQARSLNDFKAKMAYQGYRSQIYKLARDKGADVGTFSQFTNALGYQKGSPKSGKQGYGSVPFYQKPQQADTTNTALSTAQRALQTIQSQQGQQKEQPVDYLSRPQNQRGKAPVSAPKNASPFVKSLYEIDNAKNGADYPIDYTSPKAIQQVHQRNQQVRKQAAKTAAKQMSFEASHGQPIMQTNTPADTYIGKTEGQLLDEMNQSAANLVNNDMGDYLDSIIGDEFKNAHARGLAALAANGNGMSRNNTGTDLWIGERAYRQQMDTNAQLQHLVGNLQKNIEGAFSDPRTQQKILDDATRMGVDPEYYIKNHLGPALIEKATQQLNDTQLLRMMSRGDVE